MPKIDSKYKYGCVYKITNSINGKIYVGQTIRKVESRWSAHKCISKNNPTLLQKAFLKHGVQNFSFDVIVFVDSQEELNKMEDYFIDFYNALTPNGYTCVGSGSVNTNKTSEETRKKMSDAKKGWVPWNKNKKYKLNLTEESRQNYRNANKNKSLGRIVSEQTRKKMSLIKIGKPAMTPEQYKEVAKKMKGRKVSEEGRKNMSNGRKGIVYSRDIIEKSALKRIKKWIKRIDLKTGEEKIYKSGIELRSDGFSYNCVFNVAKNKEGRVSHKGYGWIFIDKESE